MFVAAGLAFSSSLGLRPYSFLAVGSSPKPRPFCPPSTLFSPARCRPVRIIFDKHGCRFPVYLVFQLSKLTDESGSFSLYSHKYEEHTANFKEWNYIFCTRCTVLHDYFYFCSLVYVKIPLTTSTWLTSVSLFLLCLKYHTTRYISISIGFPQPSSTSSHSQFISVFLFFLSTSHISMASHHVPYLTESKGMCLAPTIESKQRKQEVNVVRPSVYSQTWTKWRVKILVLHSIGRHTVRLALCTCKICISATMAAVISLLSGYTFSWTAGSPLNSFTASSLPISCLILL